MVVYKLKRFILPVLYGWTLAALFFIKPCPALAQVPGTEAALDPRVVRGSEVVIEGPPSDLQDADRKDNSAEFGKLAMQGVPLLTYGDHDVGESSAVIGDENGLHRTLANLTMMDDALLVHFDHVDVLGLSGGSERLYHFSRFHHCQIRPAYFAGYFSALWTALDNKERTGGPFGTNDDTYNEPFLSQFQWADLTLVAIDHIPHVAFANNTCEGAISKAAYIPNYCLL